ncbi:uncharacterized protein [Clytia hemisphaerica]|uniref:uncharacterized protein n=1 Tax=Clytia hemisphaerica TaxID=252671 RepID=UPI0034D52469
MSISHGDTNNGTASVAQPKERRKSLAALTGFTNKKLRKQSEVDGGRKSKKKEKESGGGMGGLSSLLGALHEENTSRPTSIFSETFDLGMLETYSQSARPSPSPSPSPFPNSSDSGTSTPSGLSTPSRASTPSSESKQLTFVYTNNDVNNNKQKEDRLENGKASNGYLNNNHIGEAKIKGTIISVESTSTPLKDEPKKKPRQLAKVSIKSKSKSHLSGKEYTF